METPLGGKGWGQYLLLQETFSVPGTTQKVSAKYHSTVSLTHHQRCLSLLTPLCVIPTLLQARTAFQSPRAVCPSPCNTTVGSVSMPGHDSPNGVCVSREVAGAWGAGWPKVSQLSYSRLALLVGQALAARPCPDRFHRG